MALLMLRSSPWNPELLSIRVKRRVKSGVCVGGNDDQTQTVRKMDVLCPHFRKPLILCVEKQLIGEHLQEILDKGMYI